jgi:hypothetical protein
VQTDDGQNVDEVKELSRLHPTEWFDLMLSARELFALQRRVSLLQRRDNEQVVCCHVRTIQVQHR